MQSAKRVLGIEGGGTKTEWVVVTTTGDSREIGRIGTLPASNLRLISDEGLLAIFGVLPKDPTHVGVCLAGCATSEDRARLQRLVDRVWPDAHTRVGSDRDSAMASAFRAGDGIAVIAGTGAAVHGRRGHRVEKAGGWGQLLGDLGGGYHIAMQGLRAVLSQFDLTQQISPLAEEILSALGLNRLQDLVHWAMQADKMSVARLAPCVFRAATRGEPQMLNVIQDGATLLAEFTRAVAQRLDLADPQVRLVGGLFAHHPDYTALFKYRLSILLPKATVALCSESGALGAAWLAEQDPGAPATATPPIALEGLAAASTELRHPLSGDLAARSTSELVELFVREENGVATALADCQAALVRAADLVADALEKGGRLFYVGAGTSGRLGVLDASEIPPTFGVSPERVQGIMAGGFQALHHAVEGAEDQSEGGTLAVLSRGVKPGDVVCGISASGRTPFVLGALEKARQIGAHTVFMSCNPARPIQTRGWEAEIDLSTGPELITGSTRLKAGSATKAALNLISSIAMIRLGRVRGSAMIDLKVSNAKLRDRAARLVSSELGVSYETAWTLLEQKTWNVRAALEAARGKGK
jgi:N-acetylmuramic acid 6-phosphate etherase